MKIEEASRELSQSNYTEALALFQQAMIELGMDMHNNKEDRDATIHVIESMTVCYQKLNLYKEAYDNCKKQ